MRDLFPVVVHTLLWRRGAVVLLRRCDTGYLDGWYALPGGHLQRGEGIVECAVREIREETGIHVDASQVRAAAVMPYLSGEQQGIDFIMLCDDFIGEPPLAEPRSGRRDRLLARRCAAAQHRSVPAPGARARREQGLVPGIPGLEPYRCCAAGVSDWRSLSGSARPARCRCSLPISAITKCTRSTARSSGCG